MQGQLTMIKQQNEDRDVALHTLIQEVQVCGCPHHFSLPVLCLQVECLKAAKTDVQPPPSKKSRRTPRGLSVG